MTFPLRLGSLLLSLIAGGVISAATSFYGTLFVNEQLPYRWYWLAISAGTLLVSGILWAYLAVLIADLEDSLKALPREVSADLRAYLRSEVIKPTRLRVNLVFFSSLVSSLIGFGAVALRFISIS